MFVQENSLPPAPPVTVKLIKPLLSPLQLTPYPKKLEGESCSVGELLIVKSKVTTLSHPLEDPLVIVCVAVLLEALYVFPSTQTYESQCS